MEQDAALVSTLRSGVGRMLPLLAATAEGVERPVPRSTEFHVDPGLDGPIGSIVLFKVELQAIYKELRLLCQRNNIRPCAVERRHHLPVVLEGAGPFYKHSCGWLYSTLPWEHHCPQCGGAIGSRLLQ